MSVSVTTIRALVVELNRRGLEHVDLFAAVDLPLSVLANAQGRVERPVYHRLVQLAFERAGDHSLGLSAGMRTPITALSIVGPIMMAAETLRDAFTSFQRYLPLVAPATDWNLSVTKDAAVLSYVSPFPHGAGTRFCAEYSLALATRIGRSGAQESELKGARYEVHFAHAAPADTRPYKEFFHCPVRFGAPQNAIVMPPGRIEHQLSHPDALMRATLEQTAELQLALEHARADERVRAFLRAQAELTGLTSPVVAVRLNVAPRSLRRHLEQLGTSFSALLDEVRAERAREELSAPAPVLKAVAARLGFATMPAFHRAFRRWTGQTPWSFVRTQTATPASPARAVCASSP